MKRRRSIKGYLGKKKNKKKRKPGTFAFVPCSRTHTIDTNLQVIFDLENKTGKIWFPYL